MNPRSSGTCLFQVGISGTGIAVLQMQDTIPDLSRTALVPELGADVAAGTSCDIHLRLIGIAAVRAPPDQLVVLIFDDLDFTIVDAHLAVVGLRIQFRIHDRIVDMLHQSENCLNVVLHIRNFDIGNRSARR